MLMSNHARLVGGGVYVSHGELTIAHSEFQQNEANGEGGAVYVSNGELTVRDSAFQYNGAYESSGGVLRLINSTARIHETVFRENDAGRGAGGIAATNGNLTIDRSLFEFNESYDGVGGIEGAGGSIRITNSILARNRGSSAAGAIGMVGGDLYIEGCTFHANEPRTLVVDGGAAAMTNSIVWNSPVVYDCCPIEGPISVSYSDVEFGILGTGNMAIDPRLFLDNRTDPTRYALRTDSPCINRGNPGIDSPPDAVDFAGGARLQACRVDIGAFESAATGQLDCDGSQSSDACDVLSGVEDCNANLTPDECEIGRADRGV